MAAMHTFINFFLRRLWTGQFSEKTCGHLDMIREVEAASDVCDRCVESGDKWPALRMCLTCGHVGCCEQAKNQHALKHFRETGHPLVRPLKTPGMRWQWCYVDEALLDP